MSDCQDSIPAVVLIIVVVFLKVRSKDTPVAKDEPLGFWNPFNKEEESKVGGPIVHLNDNETQNGHLPGASQTVVNLAKAMNGLTKVESFW